MSRIQDSVEFPFCVLFVDDDVEYLEISRKNLEKEGFRVHIAKDGAEGLEMVKNWRIDVAVVDLKMPCMDGMEFLKTIKKIQPLIEVILLTGYASVESAVQGIRHGAFDYLVKPQSSRELFEKIRTAGKRKRELQTELVDEEIEKIIRRSPS